MTFEEAAAIPQAGLLALQSFDHHGNVGKGTRVLINGGGGGVGTFAIQMAKDLGAEVTAVDSSCKLESMRSLGADHVIDHRKEDFTRNGENYDHIIEVIGSHKIADYRRSLAENGVCSLVGGSASLMLKAYLFGSKGNRKISLMMYETNKGLDRMKQLFRSGKVKPVIDRCFPLEETADAFRYYGSGKHMGKIIITMG
jgi:NADPH:quinone reductase-like Zn-dependent oxidoreductase